MSKYEKLIAKYDELIKETLNSNKRILIESFVDYYGEEYRNIIEKRYNEITFVYYVDWRTIDLVVDEFIPQVENPDKYVEFINLSNSRETKRSKFKKIFGTKKKNLPDNLVGSTNSSIFNIDYIRNNLFEIFSSPLPVSFNSGSIERMHRIVSFQILSLSEDSIIHEINHAITRDNIAYVMEGYKPIDAIHVTGLSIDGHNQINVDRITEELINDKSSKEITGIFKQKGGDLSSFCKSIPLVKFYPLNFYLIEEFYNEFKKYIKIARISNNKNELVKRIGKENYENYVNLVNSLFSEDLSIVDKRKDENEHKIGEIVEKMKAVESKSHDLSQQELNEYYKRLEKQGMKVKILNNAVDIDNYDDSVEKNMKKR